MGVGFLYGLNKQDVHVNLQALGLETEAHYLICKL